MSTFVLLHGAYHGAWCWFKVTSRLQSRGHTVVTFDLPGHGIDTTPVGEVTFDDYVDRVTSAIDAQDEPVVLVGHSMSGMIISQVAENRPESIDTLVYLTAYIPGDGESMFDQRIEGSLISQHFTVEEDRGVGVVEPSALEELFYADCSASDLTLARSLVRPEPLEPLSEPVSVTEAGFGQIPRVFVRCEDDQTITIDQQREMCETYGCEEVLTLESSHSPFLSMPERTAGALETAAQVS